MVRCTAVLIGALMVINVYAPDSAKNFEEYQKFRQTLNRVMLEERTETSFCGSRLKYGIVIIVHGGKRRLEGYLRIVVLVWY